MSMYMTDTLCSFISFSRVASFCQSTVRAPVFDRHQFFGTSEHYGKVHGSLLSGWMNYNMYTACCWFPTSSNILILPSQFWQIRFWKLLIALFKVPNTGAFTVQQYLTKSSLRISWRKLKFTLSLHHWQVSHSFCNHDCYHGLCKVLPFACKVINIICYDWKVIRHLLRRQLLLRW